MFNPHRFARRKSVIHFIIRGEEHYLPQWILMFNVTIGELPAEATNWS
jgi:hypothetical protein